MKATIFDYGAGNLHSLAKALECAGARVVIESDPVSAAATDLLVLPGVGAFGAAAARLAPARNRLRDALENGLPCLGICLGMQLLFDSSEEGAGDGLGYFAGSVSRIRARRVPHIGWNTIDDARDPLLARAGLDIAYFANGFACRPAEESAVTSWCTHEEDRFAATIRGGGVLGVQFHPEKSSSPGLRLIRAFIEETGR